MLPSLRAGDEVILQLSPARIQRGDVILFRDGERLIIHRVVRCHPEILTRGDNSPRLDEPIAKDQIVGRVIAASRAERQVSYTGPLRSSVNALLGWLSPLGLRHPHLQRVFQRLVRLIG